MIYRPDIDGLRALAVVPVVIFHAGFLNFGGGFLGVDIFFVISGYLITSIILPDIQRGSFSFARFYERRARRIIPALAFVTAACIPFAYLWMPPLQLKEFAQSIGATTLFSSNIFFWYKTGYFNDSNQLKPLIHTWSLAIEEQYYILFPPLILLIFRLRKSWLIGTVTILGLLSLGLAEWCSRAYPQANFYGLPTRVWELAAGAGLAICTICYGLAPRKLHTNPFPLIGIGLILGSMVLFDENTRHPSLLTLVPVAGACLVIWFGGGSDLGSRILSSKPFVAIGLISYSFYLWHQPIFAFGRIYSIDPAGNLLYLALTLLSGFLAFLSWRYVEAPFRRATVIPKKTLWSACAGVLGSLFAVSVWGHIQNGMPERFPPEVLRATYTVTGYKNLKNEECYESNCVVGDPESAASYALIGDSHAGSLALSLDNKLRARHQAGIVSANGGIFVIRAPELIDFSANDAKQLQPRKDLIDDPRIDTIILAGRYTFKLENTPFNKSEGGHKGREGRTEAQKEEIKNIWRDSINSLLETGKRVILVYPIPEVDRHVPNIGFKNHIHGKDEDITTSSDQYFDRNRVIFEFLDSFGQRQNLVRVYPASLLCDTTTEKRCITQRGGRSLYHDDNHLTVDGADMLIDEIFDAGDRQWLKHNQ